MFDKSVQCFPYIGRVRTVYELRDIIGRKYSDLFRCVIVHGSVATDEVITYSDFDGLIIVKDQYKRSDILKRFKIETLKQIYRFDPLQHHGWFEIFESQLEHYPQTYFPHELFDYSKLIYPAKEIDFRINLKNDYDYETPFNKLATAILNRIDKNRPANVYSLKGLLSQFMLLPALYCQARDQQGIFKKYSFDSAGRDFAKEDWQIMGEVSKIRRDWRYELKTYQKRILSIRNRHARRILIPSFAPSIPQGIAQMLDEEFYRRMKRLTNLFKNNIDVSV